MTELPEPPIPADADLAHFRDMPVDVIRLFGSALVSLGDPADNWYAFLLWCRAWHQRPAGSLPNNDVALSKLAGLGGDQRRWKRHREGALWGWKLHSDGKLYHPFLTEKVLNSLSKSRAGTKGSAARWGTTEQQPVEKTQNTECDRNAPPQQVAMPRIEGKGIEKSPPIPQRGFAEWYAVYPLKKNPDAAERAFKAALKRGATVEDLIASALRYAEEKADDLADKSRRRFVMHPATWLNGGAWKSEPEPETAALDAVDSLLSLWTGRMRMWRIDGTWLGSWGPEPGQPQCQVPRELLLEPTAAGGML